jgi:hypothetical protein
MTINERHFLGFIRYALMGGDYPHGILTAAGWREQQKLAKAQTVSGLLYNTVSQLPHDLRPPQQMLMKLYSQVVYYENMNKLLNKRTCEIFRKYKELGFHPILLKGQGAATLYEHPEQRVFGDIDIYVPDPEGKLQQWVMKNVGSVFTSRGKEHLMAFQWDGVTVENHLCLLKFYNKKLAARMEKIVAEELGTGSTNTFVTINDEQIEVLPHTLGLLYDIVHFSKHLISSGVGLRQLCDITLSMHKFHDQIDTEKLCRWFDSLEMRHMANAVAAAAVRYLGLPAGEVPYDFKADAFGDKGDELMELVMDGRNYGYWLKLGKKKSWWKRLRQNLKQHIRIYPYMPKEVRTEIWLGLTGRLKI